MKRLKPSMSAVVIAGLFVALSTTTVSAAAFITGKQIRDGSITGADLANNTLTGAKVKDSSLTGADIRDGSILPADLSTAARVPGPRGPAGPQGPGGLAGARGATGAQGVPGVAGAAGQTGAQGATGPRGLTGASGSTITTYTASAGRALPYAANAPVSAPPDATTWPLVFGVTLPANSYQSVSIQLDSAFNYNNPDGLICAFYSEGQQVAKAQHLSSDPVHPWSFSDVTADFSAGVVQPVNSAAYRAEVSPGLPSYSAPVTIQVRCFKAAGVATNIQVSLEAHLPQTQQLQVTSDAP